MVAARTDFDSSINRINVIDWGKTCYEDALEQQKILVDKRIAGVIPDTLVFTEHDPVYTIGKRRNAEQNLIWNEARLSAEQIRVIHTNRGGDITYHGPGQIVGYPIISLKKQPDLHGYLRKLEEVVIRTLAKFKIKAARRDGKTGIWLGTRKICAIGIAVRKWVTYHRSQEPGKYWGAIATQAIGLAIFAFLYFKGVI